MSEWAVVDNPGFTRGPGPHPWRDFDFCHDGTPILTFRCACGGHWHMHWSQVPRHPGVGDVMVGRCPACSEEHEIPSLFVLRAFKMCWSGL